MRYRRVLGVFVLGIELAWVLLGALNARPEAALADALCVNPGGSAGCYASIQAAVDAADDSDTIRVAAGTYHETVVLTESVTLEGGWNADFSARDWALYVTTIDAQRAGPVIWINAPVTTTIEGFVIPRGDDTAYLGWGGSARVLHNTVVDNGGSSGVGIELMGAASAALLQDNLIVGHGTGISAATGGEVAWDHNGFYDNLAAYAPGLSGGAHDTHGDPRFADRSGADYHIHLGSPMAGAGEDRGVDIDLDGDPRPLPTGTRPDLGADECEQRRVYLLVVLRESG